VPEGIAAASEAFRRLAANDVDDTELSASVAEGRALKALPEPGASPYRQSGTSTT